MEADAEGVFPRLFENFRDGRVGKADVFDPFGCAEERAAAENQLGNGCADHRYAEDFAVGLAANDADFACAFIVGDAASVGTKRRLSDDNVDALFGAFAFVPADRGHLRKGIDRTGIRL